MRVRNRNLVAATAAVVCLGLVGAPVAVADDAVVHTLGQSAELVNGDVVQAWTIKDLKPSSDVIPYQVAGTLWEATATDSAVRGTVQPIVSNLNARARSGQTYRVLFGVATPQGVNPAALVQGQQTTGKVYFDVTGDVPDSVVYNAGGSDLAVWVQPPPAPPRPVSSGSGSSSAGSEATAAPAAEGAPALADVPGVAPAVAGSEEVPGSVGTPVAPGGVGTPVEPGSAGTPLPSGSAGTPIAPTAGAATPGGVAAPSPAAAAPAAAPAEVPLAPAGSSGTPVPHGQGGQAAVAPTTPVVPPA
ncbi:MPT63 family protein [Mycobacterium hodleri]|uniref:MPT63 family protein n=1 Tax=Mycolicibacterium hodleri TaxID=49897 RepID=UPI0021F397A7|nr:MPT63 family protein [Mycolicibacterium hodleri]MCV7131370.1 MPT63 family protein [Mycolicibacterium hodleri]